MYHHTFVLKLIGKRQTKKSFVSIIYGQNYFQSMSKNMKKLSLASIIKIGHLYVIYLTIFRSMRPSKSPIIIVLMHQKDQWRFKLMIRRFHKPSLINSCQKWKSKTSFSTFGDGMELKSHLLVAIFKDWIINQLKVNGKARL